MNDLKAKGMKVTRWIYSNDKSSESAVNTILNNEGKIDALINNAGYGSYGAVEDVPMEEARRQFEVNLWHGQVNTAGATRCARKQNQVEL